MAALVRRLGHRPERPGLRALSVDTGRVERARDAEQRAHHKTEKSLRRVRRARRKLRIALQDAQDARDDARTAREQMAHLVKERERDIHRLETLISKANKGRVPRHLDL